MVRHGVSELARLVWWSQQGGWLESAVVAQQLAQFFLLGLIFEAHAADRSLDGAVGKWVSALCIVVLLELLKFNAALLVELEQLLDRSRRCLLFRLHCHLRFHRLLHSVL